MKMPSEYLPSSFSQVSPVTMPLLGPVLDTEVIKNMRLGLLTIPFNNRIFITLTPWYHTAPTAQYYHHDAVGCY